MQELRNSEATDVVESTMDQAKMDVHHYEHPVLVNIEGSGLHVFTNFHVFVPAGDTPQINPIGEEGLRDVTNHIAMMNAARGSGKTPIPTPTQQVSYVRGLFFDDRGELFGMPAGLHLFMADTAHTSEATHIVPGPVVDMIFGEGIVEHEQRMLDLEEKMVALDMATRAMKAVARDLGLKDGNLEARVKAAYGAQVESYQHTPDDGFVKLNAVRFTAGTIGMSQRDHLALSNELVLFVEPGAEPSRRRLTDAERAYFAHLSQGRFNPVEELVYAKAGFVDKIDNDTGLALGQIPVLVEAGAELHTEHAWLPRMAFEKAGMTAYHEIADALPPVEELAALRHADVAPVEIIAGAALNA